MRTSETVHSAPAVVTRVFTGGRAKGKHHADQHLKDMYIAELQELMSLEGQLAAALLPMAKMASHPSLKEALTRHLGQTQFQSRRLEALLKEHGANPRAHTDSGHGGAGQ